MPHTQANALANFFNIYIRANAGQLFMPHTSEFIGQCSLQSTAVWRLPLLVKKENGQQK